MNGCTSGLQALRKIRNPRSSGVVTQRCIDYDDVSPSPQEWVGGARARRRPTCTRAGSPRSKSGARATLDGATLVIHAVADTSAPAKDSAKQAGQSPSCPWAGGSLRPSGTTSCEEPHTCPCWPVASSTPTECKWKDGYNTKPKQNNPTWNHVAIRLRSVMFLARRIRYAINHGTRWVSSGKHL